MIRRLLLVLLIVLSFSPMGIEANKKRDYFTIISYHNVQSDFKGFESDSILVEALVSQFQYFKENGFNVISFSDIVAASKGKKSLPDKAILITFDDARVSFYEKAFPILKTFKYPAVLAVVGKWIETPEGETIIYGDTKLNRNDYMTWPQLKEVSESGLVEIANHSYDLHHAVRANPQGTKQPLVTTLAYDVGKGTYQTIDAHKQEIRCDLKKNADLLERKLGKRPRVMVWPYGEYTTYSKDIAREVGMPYNFLLGNAFKNNLRDLSVLSRLYYSDNEALDSVIDGIDRWEKSYIDPIRAVTISMEDLYDANPKVVEERLSKLIERIYRYKISAVFMKPYESECSAGSKHPLIKGLYFPNRHMPVKLDMANWVMWQLRTRAGIKVYAWMPTDGYEGLSSHQIQDVMVDLAKYVPIAGIVFEKTNLNHQQGFNRDSVIHQMRYYRPGLKVSEVFDGSEIVLQDQHQDLSFRTYVAPTEETNYWLNRFVENLDYEKISRDKVFVLLPTKNDCQDDIDSDVLVKQMRYLEENGVLNYGYENDDFMNDIPKQEIVNEGISQNRYLYIR